MRARLWAEGAGAALLLMLPYFFPLVTPGNIALYHHELPIRNLIGGVLLDLAALSVVFALALVLLLRLPGRVRLMTGAVLAAVTFWRAGLLAASPLKSESNLDAHGAGNFHGLSHLVQTGLALNRILAVGLALVFLLLAVIKPSVMRSLIRATRIGLAGFAFSIVWLAPQLVYLAIRSAEPVTRAAEVRETSVATTRAPEGRLVWILFDELSYRLVYDQRPAGQEFPNFERLREQSLSFDRIDPAGFYTDRIIPSLLTGMEMD
ncbi:MAG TPA: hypothetical protein VKT75_04430, partial [Acidobacteriaceae bacterium]|nr:hypothetical protein [Acidobacteriaceae bacterium]